MKLSLAVMLGVGAFGIDAPVHADVSYPETVREDVVESYHGMDVIDPYRWLEGNAKEAGRVQDWVKSQNAVTFDYVESIEVRDRMITEFGVSERDLYVFSNAAPSGFAKVRREKPTSLRKVLYVSKYGNPEVIDALKPALSSDALEVAVTAADQLRAEGMLEGERRVLLRQLRRKFGSLAPEVEQEVQAHIILRLSDKGSPQMCSYKRVIVTIQPK